VGLGGDVSRQRRGRVDGGCRAVKQEEEERGKGGGASIAWGRGGSDSGGEGEGSRGERAAGQRAGLGRDAC
jgi:hypothetical protein